MKQKSPNYKNIYCDLLIKKYPEKLPDFQNILNKDVLNELDILAISKQLSASKETDPENGKYKSYSKSTILKILDYQEKNRLNNSQLSGHLNISRNTISKWRKVFIT